MVTLPVTLGHPKLPQITHIPHEMMYGLSNSTVANDFE